MTPTSAPRAPETSRAVGTEAGDVPEWGVTRERTPLARRLRTWKKHTPLNPYWTELKWLRRSAEKLAPQASGWLLDVGGGERPYGELFAPHVSRYTGMEYPPASADVLNPQIWSTLKKVVGIVDLWGDGRRIPCAEASFDTVMALEVLEHVPSPDELMPEFHRVLKPGGRLILTVPFAAPLHQLPYDYRRFTPGGLKELCERNGFVLETLEPRGNFAAVAGSLLAQYLLRALGARKRLHDGSVELSRWRAPLVLPLVAAVQLFFDACARMNPDTTYCLGYSVVARRD